VFAGIVLAQTQNSQAAASAASTPSGKPSVRSASELYEEVAVYEQKKFRGFERDKVPYDPKLRDRVVQERNDLARKNAVRVRVRILLCG